MHDMSMAGVYRLVEKAVKSKRVKDALGVALDPTFSSQWRTGNYPRKPIPSVITTFQSAHGWTSLGTTGGDTNFNDTSDYCAGTQSLRLTSAGAGAYAAVQKAGLALNMTGKAFKIKLKIPSYTNFGSATLYAGTANLTSSFSGQILNGTASTTAQQHAKEAEWTEVTIPWSDLSSVTGTPDRAAIDTLRILIYDRNNQPTALLINEVSTIPEPSAFPNGAVVLSFDDSPDSTWTIARPRMDLYGFRGVVFPIIDLIGQPGRLSVSQLRSLQDVSGWEVGGHATTTATHATTLTGMTQSERITELVSIRKWQQANGFTSDSYAYPSGNFDTASETDVLRFYRLARGAYPRTHETIPPARWGRIRAENPGSMNLASMKASVDFAKNGKCLSSLMFHDIASVDSGNNGLSTPDFNALIDYIATQGVQVITYADLMVS